MALEQAGCCSSVFHARNPMKVRCEKRACDILGSHTAEPVAKRLRSKSIVSYDGGTSAVHAMSCTIHQFSLVGGKDYESKEVRLQQLLARLPSNGVAVAIYVDPSSAATVQSIVDTFAAEPAFSSNSRLTEESIRLASASVSDHSFLNDSGASLFCAEEKRPTADTMSCASTASGEPSPSRTLSRLRSDDSINSAGSFGYGCTDWRADSSGDEHSGPVCNQTSPAIKPPPIYVVTHNASLSGSNLGERHCQYLFNYDMPSSGHEYVRRLAELSVPHSLHRVVYTLVSDGQQATRRCREIVGLLRRAKEAVLACESIDSLSKAAELDSAIQQLDPVAEMEEGSEPEEDKDDDINDDCSCFRCRSQVYCSIALHAPSSLLPGRPRVEAVHVPLQAIKNMETSPELFAPRVADHVCTVICLHCLYNHTPWDGWEHLFALPAGMGGIRVVFVLADDVSWHTYPDSGTFCAGVAWLDLLDASSMDRTDRLLDMLIEHETKLLDGHSERIILMGASQGGAQAMLRLLRSQRHLGGWIGAVCHIPTVPHLPRNRDPLLTANDSIVNSNAPVRLLAGELDTVFPPALILRDAARLRNVGRFTNVSVEIQKGLSHDGFLAGRVKQHSSMTASDGLEDGLSHGDVVQADPVLRPGELAKARHSVPELLFARRHLPSMLQRVL